jgi:signal recognition particle subunit SRP54
MLENLMGRLQETLHKIRGFGKINEDNVSDIIRDIRLSLLEADVNYQVVKEFTSHVKEKALGEEVSKSLKPSEVFIKIIYDELVNLLGNEESKLELSNRPNILMLSGLQGSGKTTTIGKIALWLRKKHSKKPLLVACDIYRPAAIDQLKQIGKELNIDVYSEDSKDAVVIANNALKYANDNNYDYVLIDTAGRLHIDDALMQELESLNTSLKPHEVILVIDSMMGQDAINVINTFKEKLPLTGAIITKLDGDTRGGVALSLRYLTNIPIKFIGVSEKMDGLEAFDPKRMANRLLGMGDILSIVEKVEDVFDQDMIESSKRLAKKDFSLEDFLDQLRQIKKLGPLENILKMMPGASKMGLSNVKVNPKDMAHLEAIISSMTPHERLHPEVLKASRKIRIAKGSGTDVSEVNRLLKQFEQMKLLMKQIKNGNFKLPL